MLARRSVSLTRCRTLLCLAAFAALVGVCGPVAAQVYIPPPDDVIEIVPVLPPSGSPANGVPLPAPVLPPSLPVMTVEEAKQEARDIGGTLREDYKDLTDAPDAAAQIPGYAGTYPGQTSYYDDPGAMGGAGASAAYTSEGFQTVHDPNRPTVNVVKSDIQRAVDIEADPEAYLDGENLDGSGGDCVPLPPGSGSANYAEYTCNVGSGVVDQPQSCTSNLTVEEWSELAYQYFCVKNFGFNGCLALEASTTCRQTSTIDIDLGGFGGGIITVNGYECDSPVIDPNTFLSGTVPKTPPPGAFQVVSNAYRCNNDGLSEALTVDPLTLLPINYVTGLQQCTPMAADSSCTEVTAAAVGLPEQVLCKTWEFFGDPFFGGSLVCTEFAQPEKFYSCSSNVAGAVAESSVSKWFVETWVDAACAVNLGTCTFAGEVCTAPNETRIIGGVPVTRACWAKSKNYMCQNVVGGLNDCGALEANAQCTLYSDVCLDDPPTGGACVVSERVYRCPIAGTTPEPTQYICGGDVYCVNGECETIEREASDEFKDAVVALNALGQANAEFDESTLTLFKGTVDQCSHKVFGLSNCCSGSGIPLLTPWLCNAEEKLLDQKDDAGLCHKVGTYCSSKFLGICITKKDSYCCYQSKLSRIIQEQGRPQIGLTFGTPKVPICDGFSIFQFQQLDLSVMDFREVYAEFQDAARLPNEAQALIDIQTKIEAYYARGGAVPEPQ